MTARLAQIVEELEEDRRRGGEDPRDISARGYLVDLVRRMRPHLTHALHCTRYVADPNTTLFRYAPERPCSCGVDALMEESNLPEDHTSVCADCGAEPKPGEVSHWCPARGEYASAPLISKAQWEEKRR